MAARKDKYTVDPPLKSTEYKDQFDHDSGELLFQLKIANEAAKSLSKKQKKIEEKQNKVTSKHLPMYKEKYNKKLKKIRTAVNKMQDILSDGGFNEEKLPRKIDAALTADRAQRRKHRSQIEKDTFDVPKTECMMCIKKEGDIKKLEDKLKSFERKEKEYEKQLKEILESHDKLQEKWKSQEKEILREKDSRLQRDFDEQDMPYDAKRSRTWTEPRKQKKRSGVPFADAKEQCMKCYGKDEKITCLEANLKQTNNERAMYQRMFKEEQEGKEDALRRLSAVASSKLRDNPNIADLSDQNRPTKIAEKMSELYDNQWTEAYSVLEGKGLGEKQIIKSLLDMFMAAFEVCSKLASENFFERVQRCIEIPIEANQPTNNYTVVMPDQLKQQVKEFRKARARFVIKEIEAIAKKRIQIENQEAVSEYLTHCIEIGWFCVVQDPPLVVRREAPVKFDTNIYKDYTRRGKYTEFVIWPALYLHDGGALLSKGVAQGIDTPALNNGATNASGTVSSAGYQPQNPHHTYSATAPRAQHVTEIHVQKPGFDGIRSVDNRANLMKDSTSPRPIQQQQQSHQQHNNRTTSVQPATQRSHNTAL